MKKVAVFASGSGSNAENLIRFFSNSPNIRVMAVYSNNPNAYVLERIKPLGVPGHIIGKTDMSDGSLLKSLQSAGIDIVVLAGDINLGAKGIEWIKDVIPTKPVVYVLGNHEYYKGSYPKTLHKIKEETLGSNIHVLENFCIVQDCASYFGMSRISTYRESAKVRMS